MGDAEPAPGAASIYPRVVGGLGRRRPKVRAAEGNLDARGNGLRVVKRFNDGRTYRDRARGRTSQAVFAEMTDLAGLEVRLVVMMPDRRARRHKQQDDQQRSNGRSCTSSILHALSPVQAQQPVEPEA